MHHGSILIANPKFHSRWIAIIFVLLSYACSNPPASDPVLLEAIRWYTGEAGVIDNERAKNMLERAAEDGDALSIMWLARVHSTGRMNYKTDKAKAAALSNSVIGKVEIMARAGNAEANFLMGTAYAEGLGKLQSSLEAVRWYKRAASMNVTLAQHNIGNAYASGTGVAQSDKRAAHWWLVAAKKGDAIPQLRLGEIYEEGIGVKQDLLIAMHWYQESAKRGNTEAAAALRKLQEK